MRAGPLRHLVSVRRRTPIKDGGVPVPGAPAIVHANLPAEVQSATASSMERVFGGQVQATATHSVRMRYLFVRMTDEIVWHDVRDGQPFDRVLHVVGQHEDARKRELIVACQELMS